VLRPVASHRKRGAPRTESVILKRRPATKDTEFRRGDVVDSKERGYVIDEDNSIMRDHGGPRDKANTTMVRGLERGLATLPARPMRAVRIPAARWADVERTIG